MIAWNLVFLESALFLEKKIGKFEFGKGKAKCRVWMGTNVRKKGLKRYLRWDEKWIICEDLPVNRQKTFRVRSKRFSPELSAGTLFIFGLWLVFGRNMRSSQTVHWKSPFPHLKNSSFRSTKDSIPFAIPKWSKPRRTVEPWKRSKKSSD
jgi:hypothetical protein